MNETARMRNCDRCNLPAAAKDIDYWSDLAEVELTADGTGIQGAKLSHVFGGESIGIIMDLRGRARLVGTEDGPRLQIMRIMSILCLRCWDALDVEERFRIHEDRLSVWHGHYPFADFGAVHESLREAITAAS